MKKIIKITKRNSNVLLLLDDNDILKVDFETYYHFILYDDKELSLEEYERIKKYDAILNGYNSICKKLKTRYLTQTKIENALKNYPKDVSNEVILRLKGESLVDDEKQLNNYFVNNYVKYGPLLMELKLKKYGFVVNDVETLIANFDKQKWLLDYMEYNNIKMDRIGPNEMNRFIKSGFPSWILDLYIGELV